MEELIKKTKNLKIFKKLLTNFNFYDIIRM